MAQPRPTVEVQWAADVWVDVTADVHSFDEGHGGARQGNPDRPTAQPAQGQMVLAGAAAATGQRFACRATLGQDTLFSGWAQEPRILKDPVRTSWRLEGRSLETLNTRAEVHRAAAKAAALFTDPALGALGAITTRNLPDRDLKTIAFAGRIGGFLSRAALVNSAEIVENRLGAIIAANPHISAIPAGARLLAAADTTIIGPDTAHRADRVRNRATVRIDAVETATNAPHSQEATASSSGALTLAGSAPIAALPADTTLADWAGTVLAARLSLPASWSSIWTQTYQNGPYSRASSTINYGWRTVTGATITLGTPTADAVPFAVTIPASAVPARLTLTEHRRFRGYLGGYALPGQPPPGYTETAQATINTGNPRGAEADVQLTATRTTTSRTPERFITADIAASQSLWGVRELDLPYWIAATATDVLEAQLTALAEVRDEHTLTIPLQETAARTIDAGDYVTLQIRDPRRDVDINEVCLVVGRELSFGRRRIPKIRLRCLETGQSGPLPIRPPAGLTATALTTTSIRVAWGNVPAGSQPATGWHIETRPVTSTGAWARVASDASARTVDITGLQSATSYDVRVRAVTSPGNSAWANTTVRTLTPEPAPGVPQNLAVDAVATSAIDADWSAPDTGGSVTSYTLRWRVHGSGSAWSSRTGFSGRSGRITGLSPSTDYEVQVRANGPGGSSGYSASARATTADPPAPGVPTMVAASAGDTTIMVTWGDPSDGGAAANYTVEWTAGGVGLTHTLAAGTNRYTITGLTNDVEYTIRVRASNAGGTSAWSPSVTATPEEAALMGPTFSRGPGNVVANIYIRIRMDAYTAPAGYTRNNNSAVEVEVSDGNATGHGWRDANPNNRTYGWWQLHRYRQWPHTTWPKQIRARISLTPTSGGAAVWSNWETTTFAAASSAPTDRTFSAWTLDGRLLVLDDRLLGQENDT